MSFVTQSLCIITEHKEGGYCRQNIGQTLYFFLQLLQGMWVVLMTIHINVIGNEEMKSRPYNDS